MSGQCEATQIGMMVILILLALLISLSNISVIIGAGHILIRNLMILIYFFVIIRGTDILKFDYFDQCFSTSA